MAGKLSWKKIRRGIKYPILVFLIKAFILFVRLFPRKFVLAICRRLGSFAFWLVKGERQKTIRNLSLIYGAEKSPEAIRAMARQVFVNQADRKSTRLNSSHVRISYAVFCLKKKTNHHTLNPRTTHAQR